MQCFPQIDFTWAGCPPLTAAVSSETGLCQGTNLRKVTKNSAAFNITKRTAASITLKWKKFGTTGTLPRNGHSAKLSNRGTRAFLKEGTGNPMVTLAEL